MKVNNLLKKVGSVVTAAALLASLGTTAFADVVGNAGTGVNITGISKADKGNGVYEVTVNYESVKANEVGVTMLMYGAGDNSNLSLDTNADNNKYGEGMKIVAIDQDNAAEITDNKGAFTFKVTTDSNAAGGYYLAKGKTALIAVNGDSATGHPAYASLAIPYVANYAAAIDDIKATVEANATENQIKEALDNKAKDETADLKETAEGNVVATAALTNADISAWTLGTDGKYTATATLAKTDLVADDAVEMADNVTVALTATLTKTAVNADKISAIEGASAPTGDETAFTMTVDKDSFTADQLLVGKKVTVAKDNVTAQITLTSAMITVPDYTASDNDQTITYTVKVPASTDTGNNLLNVTTELTADVKVTVTSKPVVNKIELVGSAISVEVTKGDDDAATIAAIKAALNKAVETGYTFKVTDTKGGEVEDVALKDTTYEWTVTSEGKTFTAALKVSALPATVTAEFTSPMSVTIATAPVITVNEKPAYTLGDVVVDGNINSLDAVAVMKYATGIDKNLTAEQLLAANVTKGDSVINSLDAVEIMKKATGIIKKFPIEE